MEKLRLGIFASGGGTTGEVIFDKAAVILTNNPQAGVIELAKQHHIPCEVLLPRSEFRVLNSVGENDKESSRLKYGEYLITILSNYAVTHGSLNGFDTLIPQNVIQAFKLVNSHPGPLDPGFLDFGGEGMHGLAVHQAVINFSRMIDRPFSTAVCLHRVVEKYDKGELLSLVEVAIKEDDTAESLQARVKEVEKEQNRKFWEKVEQDNGELRVIQRTSRVILPGEEDLLFQAKEEAIAAYPHG